VIPPLRIYIIPLGLFLILSAFGGGKGYVDMSSFLISLLYFSGGLSVLTISVLRKSFVYDGMNLYNTLTVFNQILMSKKIDSKLYHIGTVERLSKSGFFSLKPYLTREYNGFAIHLEGDETLNKVRLMSLSNANKVNRSIAFLRKYGGIEFIKTEYKDHW